MSFTNAGFEVSVATPQGRTPTVDPLILALQFNHNDQAEVDSLKACLGSLKSELANPRLRLAGALYHAEPAWTPHAVTDKNLVTGQQNYSAQAAADAVMEVLKAHG